MFLLIALPVAGAFSNAGTGARPIGNPGSWVGTNDYPQKAWDANIQGMSKFTLKIDAGGSIAGCTITESSGSQDLDDATCTLLEARGRFVPAKDADGNPTEARYSSSVIWQIPRPNPIVTGTAQADFDVDADGAPSSCITSGSMREWPYGADTTAQPLSRWCDAIVKRPYGLAPSADGKVHPKHVTVRLTIETSDPKPPN